MLTFVSGWRSPDREKVIVDHRDPNRSAIYFIDDSSRLPGLMPEVPITEVWRHGRAEFELSASSTTQIVRVNHDTDHDMIVRAVSRVLMQGIEAQVIVVYDATEKLFRLFPALRTTSGLIASDARLNAAEGDHVIFTRGGSFVWKDHILESRTAALVGDETIDMGIVDEGLTELDY
jgi:hypothetical protein